MFDRKPPSAKPILGFDRMMELEIDGLTQLFSTCSLKRAGCMLRSRYAEIATTEDIYRPSDSMMLIQIILHGAELVAVRERIRKAGGDWDLWLDQQHLPRRGCDRHMAFYSVWADGTLVQFGTRSLQRPLVQAVGDEHLPA